MPGRQNKSKDSEYDDGKEPLLLEPIHENSFLAKIRAKKIQEVALLIPFDAFVPYDTLVDQQIPSSMMSFFRFFCMFCSNHPFRTSPLNNFITHRQFRLRILFGAHSRYPADFLDHRWFPRTWKGTSSWNTTTSACPRFSHTTPFFSSLIHACFLYTSLSPAASRRSTLPLKLHFLPAPCHVRGSFLADPHHCHPSSFPLHPALFCQPP